MNKESEQLRQKASRVVRVAALNGVRLVESEAHTDIGSPEEAGEAEFRINYDGQAFGPENDCFFVLARIRAFVVDKESKEKEIIVTVRGEFELLYGLPKGFDVEQEELDAFAETNGVFNAWPYFREFIHNMMTRMGLPPLTIPLYRVSSGGIKNEETPPIRNQHEMSSERRWRQG
jgi:preprotein translocase subunit SecB